MRWRLLTLAAAFLAVLSHAVPASAACGSPAGVAGQFMYNLDYHVPQYCDGTDWVAMGPVPGAGGAGCSSPSGSQGETFYNADYHILQYCDGADWVAMGAPPPAFAPLGVSCDGANDYYDRSTPFNGIAATKKISGSFWFRRDRSSQANPEVFYQTDSSTFMLQFGPTVSSYPDKLRIQAKTDISSGLDPATIKLISTTTITDNDWHHALYSFDTGAGVYNLYIDGADAKDLVASDSGDVSLDWNGALPDATVCDGVQHISKFMGGIAEFWWAPGVYIDFSVAANRDLFETADGYPAYLGPHGELPTGTAPLVYLRGGAANFSTNLGTGGDMDTVAGTPADAVAPGLSYGLVGHWTLDTADMTYGGASGSRWNFPATGANDTGIGTLAWTNPANISDSDDVRATRTLSGTAVTNYLRASDFGFSIPANATIDGIMVYIERSRSGGTSGNARDSVVSLVNASGAVAGDNKAATGTNWPTTEAEVTYGGAADTWGLTLTPANVNDPDFGVVIAATGDAAGTNRSARVDYIVLEVYYSVPSAPVTALDSSGKGNHGTISGAASPAGGGMLAQALDFDGVDDYVSVGDIPAIDGISQATLSGWFKHNTTSVSSELVIGKGNAADTDAFSINVVGNGLVILAFDNGTDGWAQFNRAPDTDWHHFVMVFDGTQSGNANRLKFYVDGVQETLAFFGASVPATTTANTTPFYLGGNPLWPSYGDGALDDVRIYNRALSAAEVESLYEYGTCSGYSAAPSSGLVGYWTLDEGTGSTIYDSVGSQDGTGIGGGWWQNECTIDGCYIFDGGGQVSFASYNFGNTFTFSMWVYHDTGLSSGGAETLLANKITWWQSTGFWFIVDYDTGEVGLQTANGSVEDVAITNASVFPDDEYVHLAVTVDKTAGTAKIYVNGVDQTLDSTIRNDFSTSDVWSLAGGTNGANTFRGGIDEVRVYNRVLSDGEVRMLYLDGQRSGQTNEGTLVYNGSEKIAQYCNGTEWVGIGKAVAGGGI